MVLTELDTVIGKQVITQDGYILGEIQDIRYVNQTWDIQGLKIRTRKTVSDVMNIGSAKSLVLLEIGDYVINDVVILPADINSARSLISADNVSYPSLSYLQGKRVFATNGLLVGIVESVIIDTESWQAVSINVKLDKTAYEPLGVKKGLFAKRVSGILSSNIETVTDSIALNVDSETLKGQISIL